MKNTEHATVVAGVWQVYFFLKDMLLAYDNTNYNDYNVLTTYNNPPPPRHTYTHSKATKKPRSQPIYNLLPNPTPLVLPLPSLSC